ncbi:MAG: FAD-linked oxidase C-terminal domain-containing protein [Hyphomicrobiaceae bacterium]
MNVHVPPNHALAKRIAREIEGEVLFDRASRGRYSTDASIYQIEPVGVVVPRSQADVEIAAQVAREEGASILPRGGGTSQSGQTVGRSLVIDFTKHVNRVLEVDKEAATCRVEPGIVLDELNRQIKGTGLWFPVDVSTASRATIGGMTGNNSCGTRSIRYGIMRDNVLSIDAILADGTKAHFGEVPADFRKLNVPDAARDLFRDLMALGEREAAHIGQAFPGVSRRVGGYLIDALLPPRADAGPINLATLLCGSEGTLAISRQIELKLSPQPRNKALGICHFATFRKAMEAAQHIVKLGPVAVEVVDRTLIGLARDIAMFRPVMDTYVRGRPEALLLVEFAEEDQSENLRRVERLAELMGDLGHPDAVVKVADAAGQKAVWEVRAAGLNIMMSMKTEGKPVSFIEDCAVPLEHLADYTERLTAVFEKYGTTGTWYAHASVGCLHVRPVLNLKLEKDAKTMRAIAEEAFAMVREYKGAHSGEHGDGLVRSEFHEAMYGRKTVEVFEAVKDRFDPKGVLNPGKIVRAPRMNDRTLFRYKPDYAVADVQPALDWSSYGGAAGGLQGAIEMCNNNGECRKLQAGVMCPSYRATLDERDVTRGRANTLRLAISGQLDEPAGLASDAVAEALELCVSCKACRRECPTGVDMARLKIEALAARAKKNGISLHDRLIAYLPRYAPYAARIAPALNARNAIPGLAKLAERLTGFSAKRKLPTWRGKLFRLDEPVGPADGRRVALWADTFNTYFEPDVLWDAVDVLVRLGYRVEPLSLGRGTRPVCCGRTFLSAGLVDEARKEAGRLIEAAKPYLDSGVPIVGLEPSCVLTARDEHQAMKLGPDAVRLGEAAVLFEELLARDLAAGHISGPIASGAGKALLHGHCHQKSFNVMGSVGKALSLIEGLQVETVETSCCGMAGAFGYGADTYEASMKMGELSLLPAVRKAEAETSIVADGFSCRHQIADGAQRSGRHVASVLAEAMRRSS